MLSRMKAKSIHTASTASTACMRPNFMPSTDLFYSFGMNQGDVTSFADSTSAWQSLYGHTPNHPLVLEILQQVFHLENAENRVYVVRYLAT
jgi:hypothetical protein